MKKNKKSPRDFDEITEVVRSDLKIVRDLNNKKGGDHQLGSPQLR